MQYFGSPAAASMTSSWHGNSVDPSSGSASNEEFARQLEEERRSGGLAAMLQFGVEAAEAAEAERLAAAGGEGGEGAVSPAIPVQFVPVQVCVQTNIEKYEAEAILEKSFTEAVFDFDTGKPTETLITLIQQRQQKDNEVIDDDGNNYNTEVLSGFEVLNNQNHKYFSQAVKTFIACFLLDGLGHDQIYGTNPPVKDMLKECIDSYDNFLTVNQKIDLKTAVMKKDGINDSNAKATILSLCNELRNLLGINHEATSFPINTEVINVTEGGGTGQTEIRRIRKLKQTYHKKKIHHSVKGRFRNTHKKVSEKRVRDQQALLQQLKIIGSRKVQKERRKSKVLKQAQAATAEQIAESLDPEKRKVGEAAGEFIQSGRLGLGSTTIGYSVDSLTSSSYKAMIAYLKANGYIQYALNTASSRGDPASFNPENWSESNGIQLLTSTTPHITHGAVGWPLYADSTSMRLRADIAGGVYVEKSVKLKEDKVFTAVFQSTNVTITSIQDLAELIQGRVNTLWARDPDAPAGTTLYTSSTDENVRITFQGNFSIAEQLILACGLKTDGDIGGLRFISGLQDGILEYIVDEEEAPTMAVPFDPMTMTFDLICGEEAITFSGKALTLMKPSGELILKKPVRSVKLDLSQDTPSNRSQLRTFIKKVKLRIEDHLPLFKIVTTGARSRIRKDLERYTSILAVQKQLCSIRKKGRRPGESKTIRDIIDECSNVNLKDEFEDLYDRIVLEDGEGPENLTIAQKDEIQAFLERHTILFQETARRFYEEKYNREKAQVWRKQLTMKGNTFVRSILTECITKLNRDVSTALVRFQRKMGGIYSKFQNILITILKDYTSNLIKELIEQNLMNNKIFNDPLGVVDTNNFSSLNAIYNTTESFNNSISNYNDLSKECISNLIAIFTTKWTSNDRNGVYRETKEFFIRLGFGAYSSNLVSIMISAYLNPISLRTYKALVEDTRPPKFEEEEEDDEEENNGLAAGAEEDEDAEVENLETELQETDDSELTTVPDIQDAIFDEYKSYLKDQYRSGKEYIIKTKTQEYHIIPTIVASRAVYQLLEGNTKIPSGGGERFRLTYKAKRRPDNKTRKNSK